MLYVRGRSLPGVFWGNSDENGPQFCLLICWLVWVTSLFSFLWNDTGAIRSLYWLLCWRTSLCREQLSNFICFVSNFPTSLIFTSTISDTVLISWTSNSLLNLRLLQIYRVPISTSIFPPFTSVTPKEQSNILTTSAFDTCAVETRIFETQSQYLAHFFMRRDYPSTLTSTAFKKSNLKHLSHFLHIDLQTASPFPFLFTPPSTSLEDSVRISSHPARSHHHPNFPQIIHILFQTCSWHIRT